MAGKTISYKGRTADLRVLSKNDLKSLGLADDNDFKQTEFWRGQPVEVNADVAKLLLEHQVFAGQFEETDQATPDEPAATDKRTTTASPAKK